MSTTATTIETIDMAGDMSISSAISIARPLTPTEDDEDNAVGIQPLEVAEEGEDNIQSEYPTGTKFYFICISMGLVLILDALDSNILATAIPAITDDFHTVADIGWYSSAYRLASCSSQFMYGKLYKLFPIKTFPDLHSDFPGRLYRLCYRFIFVGIHPGSCSDWTGVCRNCFWDIHDSCAHSAFAETTSIHIDVRRFRVGGGDRRSTCGGRSDAKTRLAMVLL